MARRQWGNGSRQRFVIGSRRSRPKFFAEIFGPGGYCRRLYSARSTSRITRSTSGRVVTGGQQLGRAQVLLDVVVEDRVEHLVVGQRVAVQLAWPQLGARRLGDGVLRDRRVFARRSAWRLRHLASSQTSVLGTSLIGREAAGRVAVRAWSSRSPARSCCPVVSTRWPSALDSAIRIMPRTRAWRFSSASPVQMQLVVEGGDHRRDRHGPGCTPWALGQVFGVGERVRRGVVARHQHDVHLLGPDRVGRDRGGQRGVDPAGQGEDDRGEPVLPDVVAHAEHERCVDLGEVVEPRPECPDIRPPRRSRRGAAARRRASPVRIVMVVPSPASAAASPSVIAGRRPAAPGRLTTQRLVELRARGRAPRRPCRRRSSRRRRPARPGRRPCSRRRGRAPASAARLQAEFDPLGALAALVRRGVGHDQQRPAPGLLGDLTGPPSCQRSSQTATATSTRPP